MAIPARHRPDTLDARTDTRPPAPAAAAERRAARTMVTPAPEVVARQLPRKNHPLTRAYVLGARSTTPAAYAEAMRLIRDCETDADQLTIDQCKLAADILIERQMP